MIAGAAFALALSTADPLDTQADLACKLRHQAVEIDSIAKMPSVFAPFLQGMAPRGGYYIQGDVGGGPFARFVRAGHYYGVWFVWYEHGGIASGKAMFFLTLDRNQKPVRVAERDYLGQDPCAMTDAVLDRIRIGAP
jgi:hypothetical protein